MDFNCYPRSDKCYSESDEWSLSAILNRQRELDLIKPSIHFIPNAVTRHEFLQPKSSELNPVEPGLLAVEAGSPG